MRNLVLLCLLFIPMKVAAQSDIVWNTGMDVAVRTYSNMHPRIIVDAAGNPLVIWGRKSDASVFFSRWNGQAFTLPAKLNGDLPVATASWMGPDIASHGDTVYVVMKQTPEADTSSHVYIVRSFDGGATFSSPKRVEFIGDSISRFPTVTTDALGNPIVAFMKFGPGFVDSRWVVARSSDCGSTFSTDVKASGWGASAEVCDCCPGAIVSGGSDCAVLYRDNNNNIRDTWMGVSRDDGASFANGCNVDNNFWQLNSCPATGPDGIVIGDTVYSVFMSGGSGRERNYVSKASLSSVAVYSVASLTGALTGITQQNYPRIANDGLAAAIVWRHAANGSAELAMLFADDIRNGFPETYVAVDVADVTNADVAVSRGKVFVVWEDDNAGVVKFRSGTISSGTSAVRNAAVPGACSVFPNPFANQLNIRSSEPDARVIVTDVLGREMHSQPLQDGLTLNTNEWRPGCYFIAIQSGKAVWTQTRVKL